MKLILSAILLFAIVLLSAFLVSCEGDPTAPSAGPDNTVGPGGGRLSFEAGTVTLRFPAGAVDEPITVSVQRTSHYPDDPRILESTVYRFRPEGTEFLQPVELRIRYEASELGSTTVASTLSLYKAGSTEWAVLPGSTLDFPGKTVAGWIDGFSTFGIGGILKYETSGSPLSWPLSGVERSKLGQDYSEFDWGSDNRYHAGIDVGRVEDEGKPVIAAGGGIVRRIDMDPGASEEQYRDNHCMGHVVIIDHGYGSDPNGPFSLYAHLKRILIPDGTRVESGWLIGEVGNTGSATRDGCPSFGPHLHFEVKERDALGDKTDHGDTWGYTPPGVASDPKDQAYLPDNYGYHDPLRWFHDVNAIEPRLPVRVTAEGDGVYLRIGPSEEYRYFWSTIGQSAPRELRAGDEFVAVYSSEPTPRCSGGWYGIQNTNRRDYFPDYELYDAETEQHGWIPGGWVCSGDGGQIWVETSTNEPPSVTITTPANGATFAQGQEVTFEGVASDPEDGFLTGQALVWRSNLDGDLGTGIALSRSDLSVGGHLIMLTATDSEGATGDAAVGISVRSGEEADEITLGDTIYGAIDPSGDIDDFSFQGTAGQEVAGFVQLLTGGYIDQVELCVLADAGTFDEFQLGCVRSNGDDTALWDQSTGLLELPRNTTYTVRVQEIYGDGGPYRFQIYPLNRAPEVQTQSLMLNDTIDGESIEPAGDVDEFTFAGTAGQEVAAFLQTLGGGYLNDLRLCLLADVHTLDELELGCVRSNGDDTSLWGQSTGRFELPRSTTYTVRVLAVQSAEDSGPYRIMGYLVAQIPEVESQALVLNDTIDGESIEPPGDIDEFTFAGTAGQAVAAFLQTLSGGYLNDLKVCLLADVGTFDELQLGCATSNGDDLSLWGQSTGRFALPRTTSYTVRVMGGQSAYDWGPYRVMAHLVDRAPEARAQTLVLNDTIDGESIEPPGDIDEFTFAGTEGQEVAVFLRTLTGGYLNDFEVCLLADAGTFDELQLGCASSNGDDPSLWGQSTGRFTLPRATTYTVRVMGGQSASDWGLYRLMGYLVDRTPEDIDQSVAVGDTIAGESIEPPGDIDEFTFSGTSGQVIEVFFQALSGGYLERLELNLVVNAGTTSEQGLGSRVVSDGGDTSLEGQRTGQVTLPQTGTYTVRVFGWDSRSGKGTYRFHVRQ
jgi:murein DD-endopeptidase MepM/ murein hydrolase activator NlpD